MFFCIKWKLRKNQSPRRDSNPQPTVIQSDSLTTELLETLQQARVKCGFLTRTASRSHKVKPGLTTTHSSCTHHQNSKTHGQQQQCIISSIVLCQSMNDTDVLLMILLLRHLMPYNDRCLVVAPVIGKTCTMFFCTAVITSQTNYNVAKCHYLD